MIGADRWILKPTGQPFVSSYWCAAVRKMPRRYLVHLYERLTQGVSRYDAVDLNGFIADTIALGAWKLFVHTQSYPLGYTYDQWLDVLLDIRDEFTADPDDVDWHPSDRAWRLLHKHSQDLWS
ncbi:hypothetical protein FHT44_004994 [Mycolicibacterium sp. BK634]|nr:hypothetical protein [Mycolicibacterium sp. BK634]